MRPVFGGVFPKERLVQQEHERLSRGRREFCGEPFPLRVLNGGVAAEELRVEADEPPADRLEAPTVLPEERAVAVEKSEIQRLFGREVGCRTMIADIVVAGEKTERCRLNEW
jgi:hypothetical protein